MEPSNKIVADIEASDRGVIHCGILNLPTDSVTALARFFNLCADEKTYQEITFESALRLMALLLHRDLAYSSEIMSIELAYALATRFLAQFSAKDARYFTNGSFHEDLAENGHYISASFNSATSATFDSGILVLTSTNAGCFWVEDED
jgi:hypothetical protein